MTTPTPKTYVVQVGDDGRITYRGPSLDDAICAALDLSATSYSRRARVRVSGDSRYAMWFEDGSYSHGDLNPNS